MRKIFSAALVVAACSVSSFAGAGLMLNYSGVGPGFAGTVGLTDNVYLNLGASFSMESMKDPDTVKGTNDVSFAVPLWISIYLKKIGEITPYVPIGLAFSMSRFSDSDAETSSTGIGVGPYSGFGAEWSVNANIGVWGETDLGYTYKMTTSTSEGSPDVKAVGHAISLIQSGVGITYYF